jgi:hypothetical protein
MSELGAHVPDLDPGELDSLRMRLRRAMPEVLPLARSADGRSFSFQAPLSLPLPAGSYVLIETEAGRRYLGQALEKELASRPGPEWHVDLGGEAPVGGTAHVSRASVRLDVTFAVGSGDLLARVDGDRLQPLATDDVFGDSRVHGASEQLVTRYLARTTEGEAVLDVGTAVFGDRRARALVRAAGFSRHTFLCGQSGSGKTYSLGVLLERLLLDTELPLLVIDPNADFVHLGTLRPGVRGDLARRFRAVAKGVRVFRASGEGSSEPLRIRFSDLSAAEQGSVLKLDPLDDREEFNAFWRLVERLPAERYSIGDLRAATARELSPQARELGLRIENLGVASWSLWAEADGPTLTDALEADNRAIVADVSGLPGADEKALAAIAVLDHLWRRRNERRPILIVIDEAHHVCPSEPASRLQAAAAEHVVRIAGEGRKYGLHLLLATQRPDKLHPNALSQCDNLVLMRMNSRADVADIESVFSFVPSTLLEQAPIFRKGETLLAGQIVHRPMLARFEGRLSIEGGGDVPTTWAEPRA